MKSLLATVVATLFAASSALAQVPAQVTPTSPAQAQSDATPKKDAKPNKDGKASKDGKKKGKKGKKKAAKPAKPQ